MANLYVPIKRHHGNKGRAYSYIVNEDLFENIELKQTRKVFSKLFNFPGRKDFKREKKICFKSCLRKQGSIMKQQLYIMIR